MAGPLNRMNQPSDPRDVAANRSQQSVVHLDMNENPFDVPQAIKDEVLRRIAKSLWSRFPEETPESLVKKLAAFNDWDPEGILVGNGSSELMKLLLEATVDQDTRILIPEPTVGPLAQIAQAVGAEVLGVPLTETLQFNIPKLCSRAVAMKTEMVVIGSPHNPTGCMMAESDLVMLLKTCQGLVVIDETYYEFARKTFAPLLKQYSHLVILRTFSIAMGMAGLRIGYLMGAPDLIQQLRQMMVPYHINLFSATAAEVALDSYDHYRALIEKIISERERLYQELRRLKGVVPVPSHANFMVIRTDVPGRKLCQLLKEKEILMYDLSANPMLANSVRISVGPPNDNDRLVAALKEVLS